MEEIIATILVLSVPRPFFIFKVYLPPEARALSLKEAFFVGATVNGGATIWARQTEDSEVFYDKPDKWFKIWFHIVSNVTHKDTKNFKRGEGFFKYEWIMDKCHATYHEVNHCIQWLKSARQIATHKARRGIIIKVINYCKYQDLDTYKSNTQSKAVSKMKAKQKQDSINKNVKNVKNIVSKDTSDGVSDGITPPTPNVGKKKETDIQSIVNYYKVNIEEYDINDKDWDKAYYPSHSKWAKQLLSFLKSVDKVKLCIDDTIGECRSKGLGYTLHTAVKIMGRWKRREEGGSSYG